MCGLFPDKSAFLFTSTPPSAIGEMTLSGTCSRVSITYESAIPLFSLFTKTKFDAGICGAVLVSFDERPALGLGSACCMPAYGGGSSSCSRWLMGAEVSLAPLSIVDGLLSG